MSRRVLLALPLVMLVVACGGASSTDLFAGSPGDGTASEPTDPAGQADRDASTDAHVTSDAADGDANTSPRCSLDSECSTGICNWKLDRCASPEPLGGPCKRDLECTGKLCNWKLETCTLASPAGTLCRRNKECANGTCAFDTGTCD